MVNNSSLHIKDLKIIIASHEFSTGPAQNFEEYCLLQKISKLLFVSHPLFYKESQKGSGWRFYEDGAKKNEKYLPTKKEKILNYFEEVFLTVFWVFRSKESWDLYVGADCLNAFSGLILKRFRRVKKVVFYAIDYVPKRFENKFLNQFYHWVEIFCVKHCDMTWNLSPRMEEAREKFHNLSPDYRAKQVVVPEGVWFDRIQRNSIDHINKNHLVYSGQLAKRLGVQKVIEAIPTIIQKIPNFKLIITGKGDYRPQLEQLAKDLHVDQYIDFRGFIESHKDLESIIAGCALAIAPYSDEEITFSYYCDPSKTKVYLGCGLPVITTDVFYNAQEIEDAGAGKVIQYDSKDIARAVIEMMSNQEGLARHKEAAIAYIQKFDWNFIFKSNLEKIYG